MTLTTHAIVGAATAQLFPQNPIAAFFAGFASHFIIDSIPHRDYSLLSGKENSENPLNYEMDISSKEFIFDCLRVGADAVTGTVLALLIFSGFGNLFFVSALYGAIGGIAPDLTHFLYWEIKWMPFKSLEVFHNRIQTHLKIGVLTGLSFQAVMVLAIVAVVLRLR